MFGWELIENLTVMLSLLDEEAIAEALQKSALRKK